MTNKEKAHVAEIATWFCFILSVVFGVLGALFWEQRIGTLCPLFLVPTGVFAIGWATYYNLEE